MFVSVKVLKFLQIAAAHHIGFIELKAGRHIGILLICEIEGIDLNLLAF